MHWKCFQIVIYVRVKKTSMRKRTMQRLWSNVRIFSRVGNTIKYFNTKKYTYRNIGLSASYFS